MFNKIKEDFKEDFYRYSEALKVLLLAVIFTYIFRLLGDSDPHTLYHIIAMYVLFQMSKKNYEEQTSKK